MSSTGMGSTSSTTDEAKAQAKNLAGSTRDEAASVADEAKAQARNVLDDARTMVDEQSRTQRDRVVETARSFSGDLQQMVESGPDGIARDLARQVAEKVRALGEQMDGREPSDILDDVRDFARRRPGLFLLGALGAGVAFGRLARGAKDARSDSGPRSVPTTSTSALPTSPSPYGDGTDAELRTAGAGVTAGHVGGTGTVTDTGGGTGSGTGLHEPGGTRPQGEPLAPEGPSAPLGSETPLSDQSQRRLT